MHLSNSTLKFSQPNEDLKILLNQVVAVASISPFADFPTNMATVQYFTIPGKNTLTLQVYTVLYSSTC